MAKKSPKPLLRIREPIFTYQERLAFKQDLKVLGLSAAGVLALAFGVTIAANTSDDISGYDRILVTNAKVDGRSMNIYGGVDISCNVSASNIARVAARVDVAYIPIETPEVIYGERLAPDFTDHPGKTCSEAIKEYVGAVQPGTSLLGNYVVASVQQGELGTQDAGQGFYADITRAFEEGVEPVPFQEV